MTVAPAAVAPDLRAVTTIVVMAGVFGLQQGVSYPLLALILEEAGYSRSLIGLNAAMLPVGLIAAAPFVAPLARRIGAGGVALVSCTLMIAALAALALSRDLGLWFLARFVLGLGINGLYVVSETWLNLLVPKARRGRWLAIYATALAAGFALGPTLLLVTGTEGLAPFAVTIAITAATAALVAVAAPRLPPVHLAHGQSMRAFLPLAPLLLAAVGGAAAFDQAVLSFLPIWALEIGASTAAAQLAITALALGNVALQWPIGWLADRVSRRAAMLACTSATAVGALLLPLADGGGWWLWTLVFLWGGVAYGTYTVALIELGDRFTGGLLLAGNAAFAMMWGVAGLVGPSSVGAAMDLIGPIGLPLVLGSMFTALGLAFWCRPRVDKPTPIA
ncbi:MAG: MFS transporter [Alphaproteobacteria bacterium]